MRLAVAGLGSALALGIEMHAAGAAPDSPRSPAAPLIYQKARSFRVPFHFDPTERARRREMQLWVSDDMGGTWAQRGVTTPDRPAFTFRCERDGEYWLAVRTVDAQGQLHPADDARIQPSMKVIVDTTPPSVVLEKQVRSTSLASIRWEVRDDSLDKKPPYIEYQVEGSNEWRPVPGDISGALGVATWDSGYAEPLKVRATIHDLAGNRGQAILEIPSCSPAAPALAATTPKAAEPEPKPKAEETPNPAPAPVVAAAGAVPEGLPPAAPGDGNGAMPRQNLTADAAVDQVQAVLASMPPAPEAPRPVAEPRPVTEPTAVEAVSQAGPATAAAPPTASTPEALATQPAPPVAAPAYDAPGRPGTGTVYQVPTAEHPAVEPDPRDLPTDRVVPSPTDRNVGLTKMVAEPAQAPAPAASEIPTLKVASPAFSLDYAIDHAGPDGRPAVVELWVTRDGGKTWILRGKDADRVSPVQVDVESSGRYGLSLIARDAKGLGDRPPAPGDAPQMWVEVAPQPGEPKGPPADMRRRGHAGTLFQRAFRR